MGGRGAQGRREAKQCRHLRARNALEPIEQPRIEAGHPTCHSARPSQFLAASWAGAVFSRKAPCGRQAAKCNRRDCCRCAHVHPGAARSHSPAGSTRTAVCPQVWVCSCQRCISYTLCGAAQAEIPQHLKPAFFTTGCTAPVLWEQHMAPQNKAQHVLTSHSAAPGMALSVPAPRPRNKGARGTPLRCRRSSASVAKVYEINSYLSGQWVKSEPSFNQLYG